MGKTKSNSDNSAVSKTYRDTSNKDVTYRDTSNKDVTLVAIYGYGIVVMPKLPVCDQYRVSMNKFHANEFLKKYFGISVQFYDNFKYPLVIRTGKTTEYAKRLKESWVKHFSERLLNGEIEEIDKNKFFTVVETELNKCNLSFELSNINK